MEELSYFIDCFWADITLKVGKKKKCGQVHLKPSLYDVSLSKLNVPKQILDVCDK
jgi:hypothetical protein